MMSSSFQVQVRGHGFLISSSSFSGDKNENMLRLFAGWNGQRRGRFLLWRDESNVLRNGQKSRIFCTVEPEQRVIKFRKYAPLLENTFLEKNGTHVSTEWKAVPDIWKTAAEQYGDRTALIDPHHDPPSQMTYKQLEQKILDFVEGLRAVGILPDQKIALFADNSCRWLVADQGIMAAGAINAVRGSRSSVEELLQIYIHSDSVALVVDNPTLFNKLVAKFNSSAILKFVVLLWGEKSMMDLSIAGEVPVYTYDEFTHLGRESRQGLLSHTKAGQSFKSEAYALFEPNPGSSDPNTGFKYTNMFDAQLDGVYSAMKYLGYTDIDIVVAETGWPSVGDPSETGVNLQNAIAYNGNLIKHVTSMAGTPLMPNRSIEIYIFGLFNEDLKPGPTSERNFGLFKADMTMAYDVGLLRSQSAGPSPAAPRSSGPVIAPPTGKVWCIAKPGVDEKSLKASLDYACGQGIDCKPIQQGGLCYAPNTMTSHAAYAMNAYYQSAGRNSLNCDFGQTGTLTSKDPSYGDCVYSTVNT